MTKINYINYLITAATFIIGIAMAFLFDSVHLVWGCLIAGFVFVNSRFLPKIVKAQNPYVHSVHKKFFFFFFIPLIVGLLMCALLLITKRVESAYYTAWVDRFRFYSLEKKILVWNAFYKTVFFELVARPIYQTVIPYIANEVIRMKTKGEKDATNLPLSKWVIVLFLPVIGLIIQSILIHLGKNRVDNFIFSHILVLNIGLNYVYMKTASAYPTLLTALAFFIPIFAVTYI